MQRKFLAALGGILMGGALIVGSAGADTISFQDVDTIAYKDSFGWTTTELVPSINALSVSKFDNAFGTLQSVQLRLTGWLTSSGSITNTATSGQYILASVTGYAFFGAPEVGDPGPVLDVLGGLTPTLSSNAGVVPAGGSMIMPVTSGGYFTGFASQTFMTGLSAFTGLDDILYGLTTLIGQQNIGGGGNVAWNVNTLARAELEVVYEFTPSTPVPEPVSLFLFGAGIVSLVGVGRKKFFQQ